MAKSLLLLGASMRFCMIMLLSVACVHAAAGSRQAQLPSNSDRVVGSEPIKLSPKDSARVEFKAVMQAQLNAITVGTATPGLNSDMKLHLMLTRATQRSMQNSNSKSGKVRRFLTPNPRASQRSMLRVRYPANMTDEVARRSFQIEQLRDRLDDMVEEIKRIMTLKSEKEVSIRESYDTLQKIVKRYDTVREGHRRLLSVITADQSLKLGSTVVRAAESAAAASTVPEILLNKQQYLAISSSHKMVDQLSFRVREAAAALKESSEEWSHAAPFSEQQILTLERNHLVLQQKIGALEAKLVGSKLPKPTGVHQTDQLNKDAQVAPPAVSTAPPPAAGAVRGVAADALPTSASSAKV